jgi:hypothetical protein
MVQLRRVERIGMHHSPGSGVWCIFVSASLPGEFRFGDAGGDQPSEQPWTILRRWSVACGQVY